MCGPVSRNKPLPLPLPYVYPPVSVCPENPKHSFYTSSVLKDTSKKKGAANHGPLVKSGPQSVLISKVLSEHSSACSFTRHLWLSLHTSRGEQLRQTLSGPQSLKHLLSGLEVSWPRPHVDLKYGNRNINPEHKLITSRQALTVKFPTCYSVLLFDRLYFQSKVIRTAVLSRKPHTLPAPRAHSFLSAAKARVVRFSFCYLKHWLVCSLTVSF